MRLQTKLRAALRIPPSAEERTSGFGNSTSPAPSLPQRAVYDLFRKCDIEQLGRCGTPSSIQRQEGHVSLRALIDVTTKLMTDGDFRNLLVNNPDEALRPFNLSADEIRALKTRNRWDLEDCGLEEWTARWVSALR